MWKEIKKAIHQNQKFLLTTHVNPDGDGLGAACAMIELLLQLGKEVRFVCDSPIPQKFDFLNFHQLFEQYDEERDYQTDVLIILDTHKQERIGRLATFLQDPKVISICIDHHPGSQEFTTYAAIDPKASSAGSLIYTLFKESGYDLNREAATGLYASIICDTGRFSHSSTDRKAHKIAEECIKKGIDPDWMYAHLFRQVTITEMQIFGRILERMEVFDEGRIVVQTITKEDYELFPHEKDEILYGDLTYIHEFNKLVVGVECFLLLRERPDGNVRISLRSNGPLVVNTIARAMGGGGHANAAGATAEGSLEEVKKDLVSKLVAIR